MRAWEGEEGGGSQFEHGERNEESEVRMWRRMDDEAVERFGHGGGNEQREHRDEMAKEWKSLKRRNKNRQSRVKNL